MRNLAVSLVVPVAFAACAGCGAGNHAVETAKAARYRGDKLALFEAAKRATEAKYLLEQSDETTLRITTTGRWYTPEGLGASERGNDMRDVPDRGVYLRLIIKLVSEGGDWAVAIEPIMMRYFAGRPNPDHLAPGDPSVPGWATGRVDQLRAAVHEALATYEVMSPGSATRSPQSESARPAPETRSATQVLPR